jgi:hypothetical protein
MVAPTHDLAHTDRHSVIAATPTVQVGGVPNDSNSIPSMHSG